MIFEGGGCGVDVRTLLVEAGALVWLVQITGQMLLLLFSVGVLVPVVVVVGFDGPVLVLVAGFVGLFLVHWRCVDFGPLQAAIALLWRPC